MRTSRRGQAAIEFAIGVFAFAIILTALVGLAPVYLDNIALQSEARCDAGISALGSAEGADDLGNAGSFTSYAHPSPGAGGVEPWAYPMDNMPDEFRFGEWYGNGVSAGRLLQGGRKKKLDLSLFLGKEMEPEGFISEELYLPAMDGLKTVGGN